MATIEEARATVMKILITDMKVPVQVREDGLIRVTKGGFSTAVYLKFRQQEFGGTAPTQTFLSIAAPLLRNVPETDALYKWIAFNGSGFRLGSVEALPEPGGTVFLMLRHTLLVDYLTSDELETALWSVLAGANTLDEQLQNEFGGKRWIDGDELMH